MYTVHTKSTSNGDVCLLRSVRHRAINEFCKKKLEQLVIKSQCLFYTLLLRSL